ncbi:MAG: LPS export ABC transporter periplasmic protein LptC [Rhodothermales bacterium]
MRWLAVGVLLTVGGCTRHTNTSTMIENARAEDEPERAGWGVHFVVSEVPEQGEESRRRLELMADVMVEYQDEDSTYMLLYSHPDSLQRRVTAYLYDALGDSSATLTADRVFYYERERRFEARNNVIVLTQDGKRLESEHLIWVEEERQVRTPGFVRVVTPTEQLQGYGLIADENLETYQISRPTIQATLEGEE